MTPTVLYFIFLLIPYIESARILAVFPFPSISHQVVFRPLTHELARRGHDVTVITTDPAFPKGQAPKNLTEIDIHDLSYSRWNKLLSNIGDGVIDFTKLQDMMKTFIFSVYEEQVKTESVQKLLTDKNEHFDLLLVEASLRCTLGFSHVFKAPMIQISSFGAFVDNHHIMGTPIHPLLYPSIFRDRFYNLTLWEKIIQLKKEWDLWRLVANHDLDDELYNRLFCPDIPPLYELYNNVQMLFLNMHPIWENNRPVPPGVIYMGGLHQNPEKELPKDLKSYLDFSKNGVIYFSLGTNVKPSNLPSRKLEAILNVFTRLPYDVLWKWDNDDLPGKPRNIKISKWLPQSDLLRHPKIKLFITQGGLQSTDEAITAGVPLIGIPMLGDQWYNVEKYIHHKIGAKLDMNDLTEDKLEAAILNVINDKSYRDNIVRLRSIMSDQPQSPLERAVWWTEHVLRHGGARHLRSPAANISLTQYLELELVFTLATILIISLVIICVILKSIWRLLRFKLHPENKSKKC